MIYPVKHRKVIEGYPDWPFKRLGDASDEARAGRPSDPSPAVSAVPGLIAIAGGKK